MVNSQNALAAVKAVILETKKAVKGKDEIILRIMLAILARGHILLEDIPGVGKTTIAMAFAKAMSLEEKRMQFTPDVLPSDVTGFSVYNKSTGNFDYKAGVCMCNLFLADEINRTSSKTQSALLEVMEEGRVTVDGITRELPKPYIVIATQNPIGSVGTQLLPESQLDRFMLKMSVGYPDIESEIDILKSKKHSDPLSEVETVIAAEDILELCDMVDNIHISDKIYSYIAHLAEATRTHPMIKLGISPRGTIALTAVSKAVAFLQGRNYVIPDDILYIFDDVASHRILLTPKAKVNDVTVAKVLADIKGRVKMP